MPRARKVCSTPGCPELVAAGLSSRCAACQAAAQRRRGSAAQRGYGHRHRRRFREGVLKHQPLCVCTDQSHGHGPQCLAPATVADHWPRDRRELVRLGLDADDPRYGRGLCASCHGWHTSKAQPGGWAA